jgi:hypothetical protein
LCQLKRGSVANLVVKEQRIQVGNVPPVEPGILTRCNLRAIPFVIFCILSAFSVGVTATVSEETLLRDCKAELAMGNYNQAVVSFGRFIRNYPKSKLKAEALYWKGVSYLSDSKRDSAKAVWDQISRSDASWYSGTILFR